MSVFEGQSYKINVRLFFYADHLDLYFSILLFLAIGYDKGEHKEVFAYSAQVACDKHGWALAYTVEAGNVHDSQAFPTLFLKLEPFSPHYIIADSGYKTPAIAHYLLEQNIIPVFPYTRPKGVKGNLRPNDFVYDAFYDCYLCPENQVLTYRTTT